MSSIEFCGQTFRLTDGGIAVAPLIRLARQAKRGVDSNDADGLLVLGDMIEVLLADAAEVERFYDVATEHRVDGEAWMKAVTDAIGVIAARPTSRPSDSSGGPQTTSTPSAAGSSSPATDPLAARPDLQLIRAQSRSA